MEATLEATARDTFGKNEARRTRREGRVPAVVYGGSGEGSKRDATPIAVEPKALLKILHSEAGANTLISLKLAAGAAKVLVKDFQLDPLTHQVLHADFYRVAMDRVIQVTIP
jgi:large subunit ribosomal protein L25